MDITRRERGPINIWHRQTLLSRGGSRSDLDDALRAGTLVRLARGWYAHREHDREAAHAVSNGARLTCASALAVHGAWTMPTHLPHVRLRHDQAIHTGLRASVIHRLPDRAHEPDHRLPIDPLPVAFATAMRCLDPTSITVVADSLLNRRLASRDELDEWSKRASEAARAALEKCDGESQSGTESIMRLALHAVGVTARTQVWIGSDRVDLLIGDRLVIECDSLAHHGSTESAYIEDHARDLRVRREGYEVLRFTYRQILFQLDEVVHLIRQYVARGEHRWSARHRRSHSLAHLPAITL